LVTKQISGSTLGWMSSLTSMAAPSGTAKSSTRKPNTGSLTPICFILANEVSPAL
jgi:hypothetical protein